jgi:hypothetical protein
VFPVHTNRSNDSSKQEGNECVHGVCVVDEMFSAAAAAAIYFFFGNTKRREERYMYKK